jgi:2-aminoadipate transaminase
VDVLASLIEQHHPRVLVVNPNFQNPTGATLPLDRRRRIVEFAQRFRLILIEDDVYGELRYVGRDLPSLKQLDESGNTILLRSYSKASFPGLRVGWVLAPRPVVARLAEAKQISDLHSDQLSQAVLLRFAESGELEQHLERTRAAGRERLHTLAAACARHLPAGTIFVKPEGGLNFWLELPAPLTAQALLPRAEERGVTFLPGNFFSCGRPHARGLRISFGGLPPEQIAQGIRLLGEAARAALDVQALELNWEPAVALV